MKDINDYLKFGFETFNPAGKLVNRINGPGHCGDWLIDVFSSPYELAIIPAPVDEVAGIGGSERCHRTEMFPVDAEGKEIPGKRSGATLFEGKESEARAIAKELRCEVYYWSSYEETRYIVIVSAENETDFPQSDDWTYYTVIDF